MRKCYKNFQHDAVTEINMLTQKKFGKKVKNVSLFSLRSENNVNSCCVMPYITYFRLVSLIFTYF